jgi:hypothetical protein
MKNLIKRIIATDGPLDATATYDHEDVIASNRTQFRKVTTQEVDSTQSDDCNGCGVESNSPYAIDREFSLMLMWSGRMAVDGYRIFAIERSDPMIGVCEQDEEGFRSVNSEGCSGLLEVVGTTAFTRYTSEQSHTAQCSLNSVPIVEVTATAGALSYISQLDADRKAMGKAMLAAIGEVDCVSRVVFSDELGNALTDEDGRVLISETRI